MPEIVFVALRLGFLALLWLFVLAAVRVIRTDLFATPRPAGAPSRQRTSDAAAVRPPRRRGRQKVARTLVVTEGGLAGTVITLGSAAVTLGRADDSTLVLTDDYASTRHARLVPGVDGWMVEDLGSTNGTYLDRAKVSDPVPVPLGVPIRIGKTTLELRA